MQPNFKDRSGGAKKFFDLNFLLVHYLWTKLFFNPNFPLLKICFHFNFFNEKLFGPKSFWTQIFGPNFFGFKFFLDQKFNWTKKNFYTQVDTTFFTPQHSFQTNDHLTKLEFAV